MDEIKWIVSAKPADVLKLRAKAGEGDAGSARLYALYAAWLVIKARPAGTRSKIKVLRTLAENLKVRLQWQTPTAA